MNFALFICNIQSASSEMKEQIFLRIRRLFSVLFCRTQNFSNTKMQFICKTCSASHVLCSFIPGPDQVRPTKLVLQVQKYRLSFEFSV